VGLLLLLSSPYTLFITTGSTWLATLKALVGGVLVAGYFATNYGQLGQFASRRSTFFVVSSALMAVLVVGALVAVNFVAARKNKSWDLTSKKIYTLAPQTISTVKGLKEKVTAIGFLQTSHPGYEFVRNLLERYQAQAPDKFDYVFKDPRKTPDLAAKYQLKEGQTTVVLTRGQGASETHAALTQAVSEQELTNALIKINSVGEQKVYFIAGHGEWPLEKEGAAGGEEGGSLSELKKSLQQEGYAPEVINIAGKTEIPRDASLVVIAGSTSKFREPEAGVLRKYLEEGGRMLFFAEANREAGLDKLLAEYGVQIDPGIVADDHFADQSPYVVMSLFYGDHEITQILKQTQSNVEFPTSRGLSVLTEGTASGVKTERVVLTSPYAWIETNPTENPSRSSGEKTGQIPLVVASTRPTAAAPNKRFDEVRLAVFGDSEILVDVNWGHDPNRNLVMNAFAWATTQVNKITIRPPDRDISTVDIDRQLMAKLRFATTDLLPISLLAVGLAIWLTRKNK
jgi:ABC-type uncharacterized transport system involved in gliding motility auxiliary subunit